MKSLGIHYLAEFHRCPYELINDISLIEDVMNRAAERSGATIIDSVFHQFSPYGVSGVVVIAESHFAIHTWPEHGYASVDLFSCGNFDYHTVLELLRFRFKAGSYTYSLIERGILPGESRIAEPLHIRTIPPAEN